MWYDYSSFGSILWPVPLVRIRAIFFGFIHRQPLELRRLQGRRQVEEFCCLVFWKAQQNPGGCCIDIPGSFVFFWRFLRLNNVKRYLWRGVDTVLRVLVSLAGSTYGASVLLESHWLCVMRGLWINIFFLFTKDRLLSIFKIPISHRSWTA